MNIYKTVVRKVFLGVISIILLIVTFTTSTYAWFKINSSASIYGFDFSVHAGEGYLISLDDEHYGNYIDSYKIKAAILNSYNSDVFVIENQELYQVSYDQDNNATKTKLSENEVTQQLKNNIYLKPLTTTDGVVLKDLYGTTSRVTQGTFVEFKLYFKAASSEAEDRFNYGIYVLGEDMEQRDGSVVKKTTITTNNTADGLVNLKANLNTYAKIEGQLVPKVYNVGDSIRVDTSNAIRMSITDEASSKATIYELTNEYDLGSYATDYDKENDIRTEVSDETKAELDRLYNSNYNAMYTYYNNTQPYSPLTSKLLAFENKPETIRTLTSDTVLTRVQSGSNSKMLTFRFWLEGWDADCFDGITESINVNLSFGSKKMDWESNEN